jgi:hypothetical protein
VTDEEMGDLLTDAIVSLMKAKKALDARMQGVCLHPSRVNVGTFSDPDAFLCSDCGKGYE